MLDKLECLGTAAYLGGLLSVPEEFCWCWGAFREFNTEFVCAPGDVIHYTRSRMSLHSSARNTLAGQAHGRWLFMTDTDHTFEPDALLKLLRLKDKYGLGVLSGIYRHKTLPHHPVLWKWQESEQGFVPIIETASDIEVVQVDAAGAGCLLIDTLVLDRMKYELPNEEPFDHIGRYGEDMSFFLRCRRLQIPVFATPLVQTVHLVLKGITEDDYIANWWQSETYQVPAGKQKAAVVEAL